MIGVNVNGFKGRKEMNKGLRKQDQNRKLLVINNTQISNLNIFSILHSPFNDASASEIMFSTIWLSSS